jgi:hypothetical protein
METAVMRMFLDVVWKKAKVTAMEKPATARTFYALRRNLKAIPMERAVMRLSCNALKRNLQVIAIPGSATSREKHYSVP